MKPEELIEQLGDIVDKKLAAHDEKVAKEAEAKAAELLAKEAEVIETKAMAAILPPPLKVDNLEVAQKEADSKEWKSMGEFCKAIHDYRFKDHILDNRLVFIDKAGNPTVPTEQPTADQKSERVLKTLTEGVDSGGGFTVPEIFVNQVRQIGLERSLIRANGATVVPMTTDTTLIPYVDDTNHTSSVFGGVIAYWTEEGGTKTATDPKFGQCRLNAKELSGISRMSDSLLADNAVGLEALVKKMFGRAWAYFEDDAFLNGNGVGQPLGILNAGALIQVTRTDTDNLTSRDIPRMWARLFAESRDNAVWFMNQEVEKDLLMSVYEGVTPAATAGTPAYQMIGGLADKPRKTIFGRPYFVTEKMAALGSANDIGLFDLDYYLIGDRSKMAIDVSKHVYFTTNQTAWRFVIRVDGQPWLQSAVTPRNGTDTQSAFVTLSATS